MQSKSTRPTTHPHTATMDESSLLASKLSTPLLPQGLVARPNLQQKLDAGRQGKVTFLVAPAGFGKTILALRWLQAQSDPFCWIALESTENDLPSFLMYLLAAIRRHRPKFGARTQLLLQHPKPPPIPALMTPIINELHHNPDPLLLALDDVHELHDEAVLEALAFLIRHLPPQLHLTMLSRSQLDLPNIRMKARQEWTEIGVEALRFSRHEAKALFQQHTLSSKDLNALVQRTEGWISGLQLAKLSLQHAKQPQAYIRNLCGNDRLIGDFLTQEVFAQLPSSWQTFLLKTSIFRRFSPDVCDALCGQNNSAQLLLDLEHAGLFLNPLDDQRQWYRYHHLFGSWLEEHYRTQDPKGWKQSHQQAATWFATQDDLHTALFHYIQCKAWNEAAQLLRQKSQQQDFTTLLELRSWLDKLPIHLWADFPDLVLWKVLVLNYMEDSASTRKLHRQLQHTLDPSARPNPDHKERDQALEHGAIALLQAYLAREQRDLKASARWLQGALELLPPSQPFFRTEAAFLLLRLQLMQHGVQDIYPKAKAFLEEHLDHASLLHLCSSFELVCTISLMLGKPQETETLAQRALHTLHSRFPAAEPFFDASVIHVTRAEKAYLEDHLDLALEYTTHALALAEEVNSARAIFTAQVRLAYIHAARAEHPQALHLVKDLCEQPVMKFTNARFAFLSCLRLALLLDEPDPITRWLARQNLRLTDTISFPRQADYLVWARWLLHQGKQEDALTLLTHLVERHQHFGCELFALEAALLQSLALHAQGDTTAAVALAHQSAQTCRQLGLPRLFLDEGEPLLSLLDQTPNPKPQPTQTPPTPQTPSAPDSNDPYFLDPLSQREREILQSLTKGHTNKELCKLHYISLSTVKTHLRHIYSKLEVKNRTQAIERARQLGILNP